MNLLHVSLILLFYHLSPILTPPADSVEACQAELASLKEHALYLRSRAQADDNDIWAALALLGCSIRLTQYRSTLLRQLGDLENGSNC